MHWSAASAAKSASTASPGAARRSGSPCRRRQRDSSPVKFFVHVPAWLSAAQLPLQTAVLAYVGAGGLAGAAVVGGMLLSPVGEVVQEAVAPARAFVESVVPMSVPAILPMDPRQAVAHLPIGKSQAPSVATPMALVTPESVDDVVPQEDVVEATPTPQARLLVPLG